MSFKQVVLLVSCVMLPFFFFIPDSQAQDPVFTQFNMAPVHINPAFTGNTYAPLIHINSRVQWPGIDLVYNTIAVSYDQYFKRYHSGFGLSIKNDISGKGIFNTLGLTALYSYNLKVRDGHMLKMGLGFGVLQKRLNWEKLIFPDQVDPQWGAYDEFGEKFFTDEIQPEDLTRIYPNLSVGLLYYSSAFFAGVSMAHVNNPNDNYLDYALEADGGLVNRFAIQSGMQIPVNRNGFGGAIYLNPSLLFVRQANLNQLNLSFIADMGMIYAGMGYRHAFENPDAVFSIFGYDNGLFKIGYSYDFTVSALSVGSGGSHELGIVINFDYSEWFEKPGKYSDCFEIFR